MQLKLKAEKKLKDNIEMAYSKLFEYGVTEEDIIELVEKRGRIKINLENGNVFEIETINQKEENVFVEKIELNGEVLNRNTLFHHEISNGGKITFYMSNTSK